MEGTSDFYAISVIFNYESILWVELNLWDGWLSTFNLHYFFESTFFASNLNQGGGADLNHFLGQPSNQSK